MDSTPGRLERVPRGLASRSSLWTVDVVPWPPPKFQESLRWPTVGKYKVDVASFESLALPELQVKEDTDLFVIDEVGKMEFFSSAFFPAVLKVLESDIPILASIPIPKFGRDIPGVARLRNHPGAALFTLNTGNRDTIRENIYRQLADML
ncbi:uncharacterized protein [Typha latifolia]|uniref:uncharacterized protein isoform X2 n=1 Tax=Typha latifolia TaxID=4733 RepID=UPI003C2D8849